MSPAAASNSHRTSLIERSSLFTGDPAEDAVLLTTHSIAAGVRPGRSRRGAVLFKLCPSPLTGQLLHSRTNRDKIIGSSDAGQRFLRLALPLGLAPLIRDYTVTSRHGAAWKSSGSLIPLVESNHERSREITAFPFSLNSPAGETWR